VNGRNFRDDLGYDDVKFWPGGRTVRRTRCLTGPGQHHGGGTPDSDSFPVLGVNWDSATAYCNWLSAKTGKSIVCPPEADGRRRLAEPDQRKYPWGNTIDKSYANFVGSPDGRHRPDVGFYDGSKRGDLQTHSGASPYGAMDMAGNGWSGFRIGIQDYYGVSPRKNPKAPRRERTV